MSEDSPYMVGTKCQSCISYWQEIRGGGAVHEVCVLRNLEGSQLIMGELRCPMTPDALAVIEAVVEGATVITLDTVPRKWAVIAYEGIPVTDEDKPTPCPKCEGRGIVPKRDSSGKFIQNETITCPTCHGSGVKP